MASGNSGNDSSSGSNNASVPGPSSTSNSLSSATTDTETAYCIRTINYLISTLKLRVPKLNSLGELSMEVLLRIHCTLLGISFSEEFIPSANPREDAERVILSLKDRFGKDQFSALEATKIAERNPTQLRFLLENFHLILNHQLARSRSSRAKAMELSTSRSGNHLSVREPSSENIRQDSFYVLPHQLESFNDSSVDYTTVNFTETDMTDDSFQTVENIKVNVFEETTSDESTIDPLFKNGVDPGTSHGTSQSRSTNEQKLLTSSPIVNDSTISRSHQSPNVSSIRPSRSALSNLQQTPNTIRSKPRSQSLQRVGPSEMKDSGVKSQNKNAKSPTKSDTFGNKVPFSTAAASRGKSNKTKNSSDDSSCSSESIQVLKKVSDFHTKIRNQISESVTCLDDDISKLKRKPPKPKPTQNNPTCSRKPLPSLRWLMPVDVRFPAYRRGVIVPKCTSWRSNLKSVTKHCTPKKSARKEWSISAQKGSRSEEKELFLYE